MKYRLQTVFNVVLLLSIMLSAVIPPAVATAAPLPKTVSEEQTNVFGPIVGQPVLPADTTGMPPVSATYARPSEKAQSVESGRLLPRSYTNATELGDPALQIEQGASSMPAPVYNWEGVSNLDGVYPPDTDGEIGKNHYIQMVNLHTAIYDKTGTLLYGPFTPNLLWPSGDPCRLQNDGDPVVLYDQFSDRWILTQFALPNYPSGPFYECFAVSKTGNPTNVPSDWYLYTFLVHATKMDDYPKVSVWPDAYYMTVNQFTGGWAGAGVFAFDRAKMIAGQTATFQYFDLYTVDSNFGGMLPGDLDGSALPPAGAPGLFFEVDDSSWIGPVDAMRIWKFHVDWTTPANSTFGLSGQPNFTLPVDNFDLLPCTTSGSRTCIPQKSSTQKLDAIGDRLMFRAVYRNFGDHDAVLLNHTVKADGTDRAGIRWYEVRNLFGTPSIYQQGTYAPADGHYRWMGSLAFDHVGNIALGYSISSSTLDPSIRYAGRLVSDPLGTLPQAEVTVITGSGAQTGTGARWGDYSAMSIDPVDDCTFYYTQEYIQTTGSASWQTRVAAFKFPGCSIGPQGTLAGRVVKQSNPTEGIAGATVVASTSPTQTITLIADPNGYFSSPVLVGTYDVTASAYAYLPTTVNGVVVTEGATTTVPDIELAAAPSYVVSGVVKDARTGWPLYAKIVVEGAPIDPLWTDPLTGAYSVNLLGGSTFTLKTTNFWGGYAASNTPIGPLSANLTQDILLSADYQACTAPGYSMHAMLETFSGNTLPTGWTVTHVSGACDWAFNDPGSRGNLTGGTGGFAIADSDKCGSGTTMNTILTSPSVDVSTLSQIMLSFKYDYNNYASTETARVEVSDDNGATWTAVVNWGATDMRGPATYTQDVTTLLTGATQARVRFTYIAPGWDWWWEIDDVFLGVNDCAPQPGGLIVGAVTDLNTGAPLLGANVKNGALASTQTVSTPQDPAVPDAFYTLFAPAGLRTITASMPLYADGVVGVTVPLSGTVRQDFALGAGILSYTPAYMTVTLAGGATTILPMTITNTGAYTATFNINEIDKGFLPYGPFEKPPFVVKPFRQQAPTSQGGGVSNPPAGPAWDGGGLLSFWPLPSPANPWGIAFNYLTGKLWIGDSWAPTGSTIQEFNPDGAFTRNEWAYAFNSEYGPADATFNIHTGMLWVMGVRSDHENCIYEIDPQNGPTGRKICPGFSTTQRGLAYDPTTDTYFAGSWTDQSIHRFTADGRLISSKYVGLNISGLAYNASSQHLFVATSASTTKFYVLDVSDNYAILGEFQVPGFSSYGGAGLEMDCAGNLWALDQVGKQVYKLASGEVTTMCSAANLPWVSEAPSAGTLGPGQQVVVNVTFDGNVSPGIYKGQLQLANNTPYAVPNMPLKLTVQVPPTWGKVTGTVSTLGACDVNPAVLANKPVTIKSFDGTIWNLTTDSQGVYSQWIDQVHSPVTITVNLPGYQPGIHTNVPVVGSQSITKDFTLRSLQPCFAVTPPSLVVTLTLGQNTSRDVRISNSGAATGVFTTTESFLGFIPGLPQNIPNTSAPKPGLFSLAGPSVEKPTGPYAPTGDVNLVIDDGTQENGIGLTSGGDFIWLNRFTPAAGEFPFTLNTVSLIFDTYTPTGSAMQLVIYEDADGNPANGATFKYAQNVTVLNNNGATWNVYTLTTPVVLNGPGDVLIGVVNRGATAVGQYPATIDQSSTLQRRSWIGLYTSTVPDPPTLPADDTFGIIDDLSASLAGNWMIRGAGTTGGGAAVNLDWLTETPTTSAVTGDSFQWVSIGFDASKVALPGQYKATVNFNTDDSLNDILPVNVTMNVVASALWGQLQGDVEATDRCDLGQAAIAGATLTFSGAGGYTNSVVADDDGHYLIWLPSSANPFTVTASKAGYFDASVGGIIVNDGGAMTNAPLLVLRKNVPCVDFNPAGVSITLPWGGTGNQNLNLTNTGPATSQFTITEQAGGFNPLAPADNGKFLIVVSTYDTTHYTAVQNALTALGYTYDRIDAATYGGRTVAQLLEYKAVIILGSILSSYNTTYVNKTIAYLDAGGKALVAYNDLGYSWRSTATPNFYTSYIQATYVADSGSKGTVNGADILAGMSFSLATDPYPDSFTLGANATGILANAAPNTNWAASRVARNSYKLVYFAFNFNNVPAGDQNTLMGKVVTWLTAAGAVDIVPWLSEAPITGTIPANTGVVPINLGFNAGHSSITQPGNYTAFLKIANQDGGNTPMTVPVTMTVQPKATQAKLSGNVLGLLYCDGTPGAALQNAKVQIIGTGGISVTLTTDAAGYYQYWVDSAFNTYTINVSAANYVGQTVTGLSVTGGVNVTQNFNLRWNRACVNAAPTSLAATVNLGYTTTLPFTLTNTGPMATSFKITEIEGGFAPYRPEAALNVLLVSEAAADGTAMKAALTALGHTYTEVTSTAYTGMTAAALMAYDAVIYLGAVSAGSEQTKTIEYLDAGGRLLLFDNDQAFFAGAAGNTFFTTYLGAQYGDDYGSDGTITGQDIMAGVNIDISSDPYPDSFTIISAYAVGIFANNAPKTDWAGLRIERNNYRATFFSWDFQYTNGAGDTANKQAIVSKALTWLTSVPDVPWLSATPTTGSLAANTGQQLVQVTMDAAAVTQPGVYTAQLKVKTDDPVNPFRTIDVTMTVPVDPDMGKLNGVVYDLGACDINSAPLAGASVNLTDGVFNWTTTTDASGYYQFWVDTTNAMTVTATADDHLSDQAVISVPENVTVTQNLELRWLKPCIDADPDSLTANLTYGMTTTKVLSLTNSGLFTGTFTITPHTSGFIPVAPQVAPTFIQTSATGKSATSRPATFMVYPTLLRPATASLALINDGSFEGTAWTEVDNTGCTPWIGDWTSYLGFSAYDGLQYFWAGGFCGSANSNSASQSITLPANAQNLTFWYYAKRSDPDDVTNGAAYVKINGANIWSLPMILANNSTAWTQVSVDISAYAGQTVALAFGADQAGTGVGNVGFDYIEVTEGGGGGGGSGNWLGINPEDGAVPAGGTVTVDVLFDSRAVAQPGTYTGYLEIETDTPVYDEIIVPVTMTVEIPSGWGKLQGVVTDLGYCAQTPAPLEGAEIFIEGTGGFTATVTTAADGSYQYWMPIGVAPLTVTAGKGTTFVAVTVPGVSLGVTPTTQNFNLRRMEPCVSTTPASYEVTIVRGGTLTSPITLFNNGAKGTDYEFTEEAGGFTPSAVQPAPRTLQTSATGKSPASKPTTISFFPTLVRPATLSLALINDGSFELGTPWTEVDDTGCTPWIGDWSSILGFGAYDGSQYFWAGGFCGAANSNSASQSITLPADAGTLTFWYQALRSDPDDVTNGEAYVNINGTTIWSLPMILANNTTVWTQVSVNISAYAGQTVTLAFGADQAGTGVGNVAFDYVEVTAGGGGGGAVPWLDESPITGTLASDGSQNANLIFDTTVVTATGRYTATLNLETDDPQTPWSIPIVMNVILPTYGVSLHSDHQTMVGNLGTWVTHVVTVTNEANDPYGDTFNFSYSGNGWITTVTPASAFIPMGGSTTVEVKVFVPISAMPGSFDEMSFEAVSTSDVTADAKMDMTTVARSFAPVMTPPTDVKSNLPGTQVTFTLHLTNAGNYTDTYLLSFSGNGWTTSLDQTVVTLAAGASIDIVVIVTIPAGTADGLSDVVTITAKSMLDPTKMTHATLTTTAAWFHFYAPTVLRP